MKSKKCLGNLHTARADEWDLAAFSQGILPRSIFTRAYN